MRVRVTAVALRLTGAASVTTVAMVEKDELPRLLAARTR